VTPQGTTDRCPNDCRERRGTLGTMRVFLNAEGYLSRCTWPGHTQGTTDPEDVCPQCQHVHGVPFCGHVGESGVVCRCTTRDVLREFIEEPWGAFRSPSVVERRDALAEVASLRAELERVTTERDALDKSDSEWRDKAWSQQAEVASLRAELVTMRGELACPFGCSCVFPEKPEAHECGCDGPCNGSLWSDLRAALRPNEGES